MSRRVTALAWRFGRGRAVSFPDEPPVKAGLASDIEGCRCFTALAGRLNDLPVKDCLSALKELSDHSDILNVVAAALNPVGAFATGLLR
ncbi:hypothetical protein [Ovoidimarina sediminis]|uniref:hypothetical protein n=1 Tax=Ovoidimarina sediminis TaxID=3079856 RepID=UPI00293166D1|nr:hypothetical protein [Rhodophyticola sp. MJ-SS7]